jgi:divalent metal cation (Fe/Co/Zn/Cd) transporter
MTGSATLIWVMCVLVVVSLAVWLTLVALAIRKPDHEHPYGEALGREEPVAPQDVPVSPDQRGSR